MMHNPIFESSMKRRMRSWRAPLLITLYCLFLIIVCGGALKTLNSDTVTLGQLRAGLEAYIYLAVMQFMLVVLVAPALTTGAISGERERQTLDLLLCTRVSALRIVMGKLLSSVCFLALMIITSLPIMAVTMFFGGVSIWQMLLMELFLFITALACCAIGIFCSALFKRTVTATVVAYLAIFAIGVGTLLFPLLFQATDLDTALSYAYSSGSSVSSMSYYGGGAVYTSVINTGADVAMPSALSMVPKMLFINPAVGLFSLLIEQTGLLQRTFGNYLGYRGSNLYSLFEQIGSFATINMIVLVVTSIILTSIAALFVKPMGRKAKKKK